MIQLTTTLALTLALMSMASAFLLTYIGFLSGSSAGYHEGFSDGYRKRRREDSPARDHRIHQPELAMITKEQAAAAIHGRQYDEEISREEEAEFKAAGLVAVFGASDDLIEFRGAFNDEGGCYEGGSFLIDAQGILPSYESCETKEEAEEYFKRKPRAKRIHANWDTDGYAWTYEFEIPHATFEIFEGGEPYCRGLVFSIADLN